ncbi:MAG: glycosyltransferase family 2 protein [Flavobacteriaceae bacterium]
MENNSSITFSIIIPTFNSGKTLATALQSIEEQTYQNVEVRIMDGLSQDDTLVIAEAFRTQLPQLHIHSQKDQGIYDAMNKGIDVAKGDWLIFMGSDDRFYHTQVLEKVADFLKTTTSKVVYGNAKIVGDTGWAKDGDIYDGVFTTQKLLQKNICHQAIFYNTLFVKREIGYFNLNYSKSSDWDFNLRCWAKQPFAYMDMVVAHFAAGGFSTHSNDTRITEDFLDNVLQYFQINPFHPLVNNPTFTFYRKTLAKQQKEYPFRYQWNQWWKRIKNKLTP